MKKEIVPYRIIENRIFLIRGQKIMIDRDLAELYGVKTMALNQAVKRNLSRFPSDFMFRLNEREKNELITNCDRLNSMKHSSAMPYVFTEQGVAMVSSVLKSERAIQVNIQIMRIFVKIKEMLSVHKELAHKLEKLEQKVSGHDVEIRQIFDAIKQLMKPPQKTTKKIGFV
jgi:hypothetical protein